MVRKLFKHEILAYLRTIIPMHLIIIGIALLGRIIQLFDNDSTSYNIVFVSSVVAFGIGVIVCIILTLVFGIRRFYQNLFTGEGYLSFTLPVTSTQHIWVKNIVAVLAQLTSFIMIIIATCVITFGDVCVELFKAGGYLIKLLYIEWGYHVTLFIIEFIITLLLMLSIEYMLFYACISLGQTAKKNRVAAAVGVYFIYYFIVQVLSTVAVILFSVFYDYLPIQEILKFIEHNPQASIHILFAIGIVFDAAMGAIYYFITKHVINKKLNLE